MAKAEAEKPSAIRPLHDEVASRYKELVRREQALAAREKLAAEVCQAQEEREQDLEDFALRLQQQEEALKKQEQQIAKEKQEAARDSLAKTACSEARQHDEAAGLRLSERAGRLASREKRVAEDEAELLRREKRMSEKEARMNGRERDLMEAESRNMRELAARRRQAELRELRVADLESRLAEAWRYRSMDRCSRGPATNLPELPAAGDADVSCASGVSRASIGRASIGRASIGRPSIGRMSIEPSVSCVSAVSVDSAASHRMSTRSSTVTAAPEPAPAHIPMAPPSGPKQEVPEITGTHLGQAEAVEFQDTSGDIVSFKLNGNGGVDFLLNGHKEVSDVDCFARGRTLHLAGSCDKWSAARQTTVPEGQEAVLQRVLALFHPAAAPCPEETREDPPEKPMNTRLRTPAEMETSMNSMSGMVGPGEELTQTIKISGIQEEGCRSSSKDSKVVRFVESRGSTPLAPPASWERLPLEEVQRKEGAQQEPHDAEASRPRLTARKRVQVKEAQDAPSDEKWYSSALRRLTRCGGS